MILFDHFNDLELENCELIKDFIKYMIEKPDFLNFNYASEFEKYHEKIMP